MERLSNESELLTRNMAAVNEMEDMGRQAIQSMVRQRERIKVSALPVAAVSALACLVGYTHLLCCRLAATKCQTLTRVWSTRTSCCA